MTAGNLRGLAERAFKWSAVTTVGRFALQLVAQVVLARLLGPDNYGVYGIGMVVLTFAGFLSGNSFSYVLMLQKEVSRDDVRFSFTWQTLAGLVCTAAMFAGAPLMASFFGDPRVEAMVQWLSVACLLMALNGPAICLLQRDLNFRALGLIQFASYGIGYLAVGVPMALGGFGAQSLAAAAVVQAAVQLVASFAVRPHSVRPLFSSPLSPETLATGRTVFFTNIGNWLLSNLDRLIIGRLLNAHAVGLYTVAYNIASIPNTLLIGALQPTFLSTGARLQNEPRQLAQAWTTVLACLIIFLTPVAVVMALLASDLVSLLYGPAWADAAWVMAALFLCIPAWACWGLSTPVLWNTGRKHLEVLLQLPVLALAVPAWCLLAPYGIRAVAAASVVVVFARAAVIVAAGLRALQMDWRPLVPMVLRGLALALVGAGAVLATRYGVRWSHPGLALAAGSAASACALLLLVAAWPQVLGAELRGVVARFVPAFRPRWTPAAPEATP
jgi:O-antigen/teichoic acid export membrane protein